MNESRIELFGSQVALKPVEKKIGGLIHLPKSAKKDMPQEFTQLVVAVKGPDAKRVDVGDVAVCIPFPQHCAYPTSDGRVLFIVDESQIRGREL